MLPATYSIQLSPNVIGGLLYFFIILFLLQLIIVCFYISQWLKKVAEAGKMKQEALNNADAVDFEEMNPLWLKDKGRYS